MKIIGIDPGYDRLGIAVLEKDGKEKILYSDCFQTSAEDGIYLRLGKIGAEVSKILDEYNPEALAIENLFITKNQKTAMRVSEARGIIIYEAVRRNIPVFEYSPLQIKIAVTGDGSSDKSRIIKMLSLLIKIKNAKAKDDEYDAIAVALTHFAHSRS